MTIQQKIIALVGPTASGKSDLAVLLAKKFNGEVISADSRQVYRGLNLGTGKITKKEMQGILHYLLDAVSPRRRFTVAQYKILAQKVLKKIFQKNKLPIVCGGSGFYVQALIDNLLFPPVKPNLKLRAVLEKKSSAELFLLLKKIDSRRAKNIDSKNRRRLIRAIEIVKTTGQAVPKIKKENLYRVLILGIKKSPVELKKLIRKRLLKRLKQGMKGEVKNLRRQGLSWKRLDSLGLEYRWIARFLQNKISREEMIERLQKDIEHFAKRQMTWFKRNKRIQWVENYKQADKLVEKYLKN